MGFNVRYINVFDEDKKVTYTTAGCYCDLYGVTTWLTHLLQVQGLVRGFVVTSFNAQRSCIDTNLIDEKRAKFKSGCHNHKF